MTAQINLNTDDSKDLPVSKIGGVVVTAQNGRIVCDNSLEMRGVLAFQELEPAVREILWPMDNTGKQ